VPCWLGPSPQRPPVRGCDPRRAVDHRFLDTQSLEAGDGGEPIPASALCRAAVRFGRLGAEETCWELGAALCRGGGAAASAGQPVVAAELWRGVSGHAAEISGRAARLRAESSTLLPELVTRQDALVESALRALTPAVDGFLQGRVAPQLARVLATFVDGAAAVASFVAAVLTEMYLCNVCSCQEMLRRNGRGQPPGALGLGWCRTARCCRRWWPASTPTSRRE
jgi:hypothetical protein